MSQSFKPYSQPSPGGTYLSFNNKFIGSSTTSPSIYKTSSSSSSSIYKNSKEESQYDLFKKIVNANI
jgi:hypothetical protein